MTAERVKKIAYGWYSQIKFQISQNTVGIFLNPGSVLLSSIPGAENWSKFYHNTVMAPLEATWQCKSIKVNKFLPTPNVA